MKSLPLWVFRNLYNYNNCLIERKMLKSFDIEEFISLIESKGFKGVKVNEVNANIIIEVSSVDQEVFRSNFNQLK